VVVNFNCLQGKFETASELVNEILRKTDFSQQKRIKDLIKKEISDLQATVESDDISELLRCHNNATVL